MTAVGAFKVRRKMTSCATSVAVGLLPFLTALPSRAAYSNYNSVLIGERAAGLAGAFTALTGDVAATPFYNPAGTVLMKGSSLSAAVNVYNKYESVIGNVGDFNESPQRLNRGYFRSLPSSSGTVLHFGSFAIGLSILVPDYDFYSGQLKGTTDDTAFLSNVDESLWVGSTFSTRLTEIDSAGVSLYYTARNLSRSTSDRLLTNGGTAAVITSEEKNITANSVVSVFGYQRRLSDTWVFGASYRPPSLPIAGEGTYYKSITDTNPYTSTVINRSNLRALTKIPARLGLGLAREIKGRNTLSIDMHAYEGLSYRDLPELPEGADQVDHKSVVNFSIGYEEELDESFRLRFGFFTNRSSHPPPDVAAGVRQGDHVEMEGFSANLNLKTKEGTSFTFGGYYTAGRGYSTQIVGNQLTVVPKTSQVFTMLIATGFAF